MAPTTFFSDFLASVVSRPVIAEAPKADVNDGIKTGTETGSSGTAQQRGHAGVRGGVSTKTPATGNASGESAEEAEANKADMKKGGPSSAGNGKSNGSDGGKAENQGSGLESKLKDCINSKQCVPAKKQYNDCITQGKGDCTEELLNLAQRITQCAK